MHSSAYFRPAPASPLLPQFLVCLACYSGLTLESNLKALESRAERDPEALAKEAEKRAADRAAALKIAPHAEALRSGQFANGLITACRTIGHSKRMLVRPTWIDSTLRLEAGPQKLELRPTPEGVRAVFLEGAEERENSLIDLSGDPAKLAEKWLQDR